MSYLKTIFKEKTRLLLAILRVPKGNELITDRAQIKRSRIQVQGKGNIIRFAHDSQLYAGTISIIGDNNEIIIGPNAQIFNTIVRVRNGNGCRIIIGVSSSIGGGDIICQGEGTSIEIGKECMIADGVNIRTSDGHPIYVDGVQENPPASIKIGDHVWLGKDVAILKGVTIGDGAIVGMRALVTKDINPNTLNVGIPSREIKSNVNWSR